MSSLSFKAALLATLVGAAAAVHAGPRDVTDPNLPRTLEKESPVSVSWTDPAQFSEIRRSGNRWEARRGDWVVKLAEHLQTRAERTLPAGERLEVTITDIQRAGNYEPWHGPNADDVRFVRDIYPPRIELSFKHYDAQGNLVEEGERKLSDLAYLSNVRPINSNDNLQYEKRLIDTWLAQELPKRSNGV